MDNKARMFAHVVIAKNSSIGYHEHVNESETYYIISGQGVYNDNGTNRPVSAGDITFTPDGFGHGLDNTGTENLVLMALVILD